MKDKHSIDELFARGLRHAEAEPPARAWEGIVRQRDHARTVLPRLRRRWGGWALLLLGGAGLYALMRADPVPRSAAANGPGHAPNEALRPTHAARALPMQPAGTSADAATGTARAVLAPAERTGDHPAAGGTAAPRTAEAMHDADRPERAAARGDSPAGRNTATDRGPAGSLAYAGDGHGQGGEEHIAAGNGLTVALEPALSVAAQRAAGPAEVFPGPMARRPLPRGEAVAAMSLRYGQALPAPGPRRSWWVAATAGLYAETRHWRGGPAGLTQALQNTEVPHHSTFAGMLAGREGPRGWGFAAGLEYGAVRYNFGHLDQYRSVADSIVQQIVTFNSQVVYSQVDTFTTETDVRRHVAAVNRYVLVRVPAEVGWHRAWHRWQFGARAGVTLEFSTLSAGLTLTDAAGGTRSVEVSAAKRRSALVACGMAGADVGYAFTDRLALWATPAYNAGLLSLWPADGTPYAMPERFGVRFRLTYTICPSR